MPEEHALEHAGLKRLNPSIPILRVSNLQRSLEYYMTKLGFHVRWQLPYYASVGRDHCSLMLCEGGQGHSGTWLWTPVADVQPLFEEWTASGANILQGPTNFEWGSCEIQVLDPDNHRLRFGSDAKPGMPIGRFIED